MLEEYFLPSNQGNSKIFPFFDIKLYIRYSLFRCNRTSFSHWRIITEYVAPDTAVYCQCFTPMDIVKEVVLEVVNAYNSSLVFHPESLLELDIHQLLSCG